MVEAKKTKRQLNQKEKLVIEYLAAGFNSREIAEELKMSYNGLRSIINNLLCKSLTSTSPQLVAWALRNNVIE